MKFASFRVNGENSWGLIEGEEAFDLGAVVGEKYPDLKAFIAAGSYTEAESVKGAAPRLPLAELGWLPVIPNPDKIICAGVNYEDHRKETGRSVSTYPTLFTRFANTQTGHETNLVRPRVSTNLDFEGELAVVIGKAGRYISREHAFDHGAGYCCYNDGSVRDWQRHSHQFTPGKNFPSSGGFGPWMVTRDEMGRLGSLYLRTRLNGEVVQDAVLGDMIFDIPKLLAYCSTFTRLECGDVLLTGTPGGVGAQRTPPLWMKAGDVVEVEIERLGTLRNTVAEEELSDACDDHRNALADANAHRA